MDHTYDEVSSKLRRAWCEEIGNLGPDPSVRAPGIDEQRNCIQNIVNISTLRRQSYSTPTVPRRVADANLASLMSFAVPSLEKNRLLTVVL